MLSQCRKCPWRLSTNPEDIPNGYDISKHRALSSTIAPPGSLAPIGASLRVMVCHETEQTPCAGWMANQLGPGNNLALRLRVLSGSLDGEVELDGPQHETFEGTLPTPDPH